MPTPPAVARRCGTLARAAPAARQGLGANKHSAERELLIQVLIAIFSITSCIGSCVLGSVSKRLANEVGSRLLGLTGKEREKREGERCKVVSGE